MVFINQTDFSKFLNLTMEPIIENPYSTIYKINIINIFSSILFIIFTSLFMSKSKKNIELIYIQNELTKTKNNLISMDNQLIKYNTIINSYNLQPIFKEINLKEIYSEFDSWLKNMYHDCFDDPDFIEYVGYIYCKSNLSMPCYSVTEISEKYENKISNKIPGFKYPLPKNDLTIKVLSYNHMKVENKIQTLLEEYKIKEDKYSFYELSYNNIVPFFEIMDIYYKKYKIEINSEFLLNKISLNKEVIDLLPHLKDKQKIKHTIKINNNNIFDTWIGEYHSDKKQIVFNNEYYPIEEFIHDHYLESNCKIVNRINTIFPKEVEFSDTESEESDKWISYYSLIYN
jgi:hypothetical protein